MTKVFSDKSLKFYYEDGLTKSGQVKYSQNSITNINKNATDDTLYGLKDIIEKVQAKPVAKITTVEVNTLTE